MMYQVADIIKRNGECNPLATEERVEPRVTVQFVRFLFLLLYCLVLF